ncbi:lantibiotic dehydratase [Actinocrispum wychmicini]|uniref:Lantibiotic biosynthesis dehydratase-like protein n=1 Tax=Actinocrispum wychmicini TaxID=1213861 RepID=A0A4R2JHU8_9PSEU|nr:lantibiotic dehydratase [Actinocrispum wychmicini]TCO56576.1 lantibiotic biosynthesis dehydratase-like protein [Actinocrispum wychmicini]
MFVAPFALVRSAALAHPAPVVGTFRDSLRSLVILQSTVDELGRELTDALHDSAVGHPADFHRRVVLPLRRDVHNGRDPKPADYGTLPDRVPQLRPWLAARAQLSAAAEAVVAAWPDALAAERAVLAELCASEPLRRAAVLTGRDLVHGLERTARGAADRKARKAEPTILRYALRATSKTSPLSWYTYVGWGRWDDVDDVQWGEPEAHTDVNHSLLARVAARLLQEHRDTLPHRLAPGLREHDGRFSFRRDVPVEEAKRAYVSKEESVDVAANGPLRFLVASVGEGATPAELTNALAARLPADQAGAAAKYVTTILDAGLLVPIAPVDPQHLDAAQALATRFDNKGLAALAEQTKQFARLDAAARVTAVAQLDAGWRELGVDTTGVTPVAEDVVLPGVARLGPAHGRAATGTLARLTPLMMAFDRQLLIRRLTRDQFVRRYGRGGRAHPADCAELITSALVEALVGTESETSAEVSTIRAKLAGMLGGSTGDREITDDMVDTAETLLPQWMKARPVSFSWFVQPLADGLVVNHAYAGFGRFTSRFLNRLPAEAHADVRDYLAGIFPAGFVQYRPVGGFNPNLHPMLTTTEISDDMHWADLTLDDLTVRHDVTTDEIRLVDRTGQSVDVLYLGFLMPLMLPDRVTALYTDLSCGWADLSDLRSIVDRGGVLEKGRLRYRDVVLERRSWDFTGAQGDRLRTDFAVGDVTNALTAARLRARYGLPEHVFVGAGGSISSMADFEQRLNAPKPQYVDFGNALHTRCAQRVFTRHTGDIQVTEALPVPAGRVVELVAETWWRGQ